MAGEHGNLATAGHIVEMEGGLALVGIDHLAAIGTQRDQSGRRVPRPEDGTGVVELADQIPPLPVAVFGRGRFEQPAGRFRVIQLQGGCGGRDVGAIEGAARFDAALLGPQPKRREARERQDDHHHQRRREGGQTGLAASPFDQSLREPGRTRRIGSSVRKRRRSSPRAAAVR